MKIIKDAAEAAQILNQHRISLVRDTGSERGVLVNMGTERISFERQPKSQWGALTPGNLRLQIGTDEWVEFDKGLVDKYLNPESVPLKRPGFLADALDNTIVVPEGDGIFLGDTGLRARRDSFGHIFIEGTEGDDRIFATNEGGQQLRVSINGQDFYFAENGLTVRGNGGNDRLESGHQTSYVRRRHELKLIEVHGVA
jgi:hypothetical protein